MTMTSFSMLWAFKANNQELYDGMVKSSSTSKFAEIFPLLMSISKAILAQPQSDALGFVRCHLQLECWSFFLVASLQPNYLYWLRWTASLVIVSSLFLFTSFEIWLSTQHWTRTNVLWPKPSRHHCPFQHKQKHHCCMPRNRTEICGLHPAKGY